MYQEQRSQRIWFIWWHCIFSTYSLILQTSMSLFVCLSVTADGDGGSNRSTIAWSGARLSAPRIAFTDDSGPVTSCSEPAESARSNGTVDGILCLPTTRSYRYLASTESGLCVCECVSTVILDAGGWQAWLWEQNKQHIQYIVDWRRRGTKWYFCVVDYETVQFGRHIQSHLHLSVWILGCRVWTGDDHLCSSQLMKLNISLCLIMHNAMTAYAIMQVQALYITSPRHQVQCVVSFKPLSFYSWVMTLYYPLDI